ncbi:flagellar biosynthetic protein FliR [Tepidibacillus marianensis]|uniref:flagellar biosynthetic protein FliR n=1 Tax=Tepidibacillus marianensis TaxID=3131995 RepID=UPI0030CBBA91
MINLAYFYLFLLVFIRMTSFFVTAPVFASKGVPTLFKLGLAIFISLLVLPVIKVDITNLILDGTYVFYIFRELLVGLALGWIAQLLFTAVQVAGSFIDLQIGFAIANVIDPQTGIQSPLMGNFKYMFAMLLFLALDGHHLFIDGIVSSYYKIPIGMDWIAQLNHESTIRFVLDVFNQMFVIAFKMAAPIVGTVFLSDIALGIVSRTVPQLNIFVVGLPIKIFVAFLIMIVIAPGFIYILKQLFDQTFSSMRDLINLMGS